MFVEYVQSMKHIYIEKGSCTLWDHIRYQLFFNSSSIPFPCLVKILIIHFHFEYVFDT